MPHLESSGASLDGPDLSKRGQTPDQRSAQGSHRPHHRPEDRGSEAKWLSKREKAAPAAQAPLNSGLRFSENAASASNRSSVDSVRS